MHDALGGGVPGQDPRIEQEADGSWRVTVHVSPENDNACIWLKLARAAIALYEREEFQVRFDLVSRADDSQL